MKKRFIVIYEILYFIVIGLIGFFLSPVWLFVWGFTNWSYLGFYNKVSMNVTKLFYDRK